MAIQPVENKRKTPSLAVDYSADPNKILDIGTRARLMSWHPEDVLISDDLTGLFTSFPQICCGEECNFKKTCPVSSDPRFVGSICVVERVKAFRLLLNYIEEMQVTADRIADISMIGDLIKLSLLNDRLEIGLSNEDVVEDKTTYKENSYSKERVVNIRLEEMRRNRVEMKKLYDSLMVSRKARMEKELQEGAAATDMANAIAKVMKQRNISERGLKVPFEES